MNRLTLLVLGALFPLCSSSGLAQTQAMFVDTASTIYEYNNGVQSTFATGSHFSWMTFDRSGNLFVDSNVNGTISEYVNTDGILSSTPISIASGLVQPTGMVVDGAGNLYVSVDNGTATGPILEYASTGGIYSSSPITYVASVYRPYGLVFDSSQNLYIASFANPGGAIIEALPPATPGGASAGTETFDDSSNLTYPIGLAMDSAGDLYVSLSENGSAGKILKYTPEGVQSTLASGLNYPGGLAFDSDGNLFATSIISSSLYEFANTGGGVLDSTPIVTTLPGAAANVVFEPVPEPSTWVLLGIGSLTVGTIAYRRRKVA